MGLEDFEVRLAKCVISMSHVFDGLGEIRRQKCAKCCESPKKGLSCPLFVMAGLKTAIPFPGLPHWLSLGASCSEAIDPFGHLTISIVAACPIWSYGHLGKFIYRIP